MKTFRARNLFKLQSQNQGLSREELINIFNSVIRNYQAIPNSQQEPIDDIINIKNHTFLERRTKYSKDFSQSLDPRDREIIIPFQTQFNISKFMKENQESKLQENQISGNEEKTKDVEIIKKTTRIIESQQYVKMKREVYDYVSEVCENVNSVVFQLLNEGKLTQNEAKALAAKNILGNIQSILTQIKIKFNQSKKFLTQECQQLLLDLTRSINEELNEIMQQLASHYPQAQAVGETMRMKEVIIDVNRLQDQSNDLIFANSIKIDKYIKRNQAGKYDFKNTDPQDYTGFIMQVINKAITITRKPISKDSDQTIFEKFNQFSETLFCLGKQLAINQVQQNKIMQYFRQIFLQPNTNMLNEQQQVQKEIQKNLHIEDKQKFNKLLQEIRSHHKYVINQKIPNYVKPFNDFAIKNANFQARHSSVLRIMTK